jgi:hypothetical protein
MSELWFWIGMMFGGVVKAIVDVVTWPFKKVFGISEDSQDKDENE